jgi:DNA-binding HxlR family transcriptional regulator
MPIQSRVRAPVDPPERRSRCPIACALDLLGDRWTLLVIRDLLLGRARFREFMASPERIPTNILADRLERLLRNGIVEQFPAEEGARRLAYRLTPKGEALRPVIIALRDWGLAWDKSAQEVLKPLVRIAPPRNARKKTSTKSPSGRRRGIAS